MCISLFLKEAKSMLEWIAGICNSAVVVRILQTHLQSGVISEACKSH